MQFGNDTITYNYIPSGIEMRETTPITISDKEGNLLFYTNGNTIVSHDHKVMENGLRLNEGSFFSNYNLNGDSLWNNAYEYLSYIVLPDPDDENIFYLLHTMIQLTGWTDTIPYEHLWYSNKLLITKINMVDNGGKGRVVYKNKTLYSTVSANKFNVVRHGNGIDWWVLMRNLDQTEYEILELHKDSLVKVLHQPVPSVALKPFDWDDSSAVRYHVPYISPDGQTVIDGEGLKGYYRIFDFDRCEGILQFRDTLDFGIAVFHSLDTGFHKDVTEEHGYRTIGFSPNSRYIYVGAADGYWQYDIEAPDIIASGIKLSGPPIVMEDLTQEPILWQAFLPYMAPGPDGKLYAIWRAIHHVVNQPNEKGLASDFCLAYEQPPSCLNVPHHLFSPWYPNYRLGPLKGSDCDTIISSVLPEQAETYGLRIFPNPASSLTYFDITLPDYASSATRVVVYDLWGREVYNHTYPEYAYMHTLDTSMLPAGIYSVRLFYGGRSVVTERLVVNP
jgi:hypothetical protein